MSSSANNTSEQLEKAFHLFNQFSEKLSVSYSDLEGQVQQLTNELTNERNERLIQLAEKEKLASRLESLFDVLPAGIVVLDAEGYIAQTNSVAHEIFSMCTANADCIGKKWLTVAADTFSTEGNEIRLEDGRWVNISACPLNDEPGKIILITDVTENHVLHEELNRQERLSALGEMIASLAHQVRTPLSSALLYMSTSTHPSIKDNRRCTLIEKAKDRMHHLEHIVEDMLMFARGDVAEAEYILAREFFGQLKKTIESDCNIPEIEINLDRSIYAATIKANSDVLQSTLQNIIDNAVDACDNTADDQQTKMKRIIINVMKNKQDMLEIEIRDNGCGIPDEIKDRVIEPFYTTRCNGTGLGLAVVNNSVTRYGGNVRIDSEPGNGTGITITLPCSKADMMLPSSISNTNVKNKLHKKKKVLSSNQEVKA